MPNLLAAVVGNQQAAVLELQQPDRPAPNFLLIWSEHPPGNEITYRAGGFAVLKGHEGYRIAYPERAVGRPMVREERAALILLRKLFAGVEEEVEHCAMRLKENVWCDGLRDQIHPL